MSGWAGREGATIIDSSETRAGQRKEGVLEGSNDGVNILPVPNALCSEKAGANDDEGSRN